MALVRRRFLQLASASAVVAVPFPTGVAAAQPYPARPIRMIVPVAAGGPVDAINRIIVQKLSERWGSQFHVENIPTGAGNVATGTAAKAPADGHTVLAVTTAFVINPSLYANLPYDPVKDFAPITLVGASPHVMVVHPSLPANSAKELVALVKANPGKYSYASPGTGQSGQLAGEMFRQAGGLDLAHVPFNGAVPAITSTIAGHTQIAFMSLAAAAGSIKDGKLRALAVTSHRRSDVFQDVPTMAEAGIPDQESVFGQGLVLPARTPKEIIDRWHREVVSIVGLPEVKERMAAMNLEPVTNTPEEFAEWIKTEIPRWRKVIDDAKIKKLDER
jgi:tripartite-type tricarboxylate transporter receptor subunit TctC